MAQGPDHERDQVQNEDQEALRLMRAFYNVRDPEARRIIVALVEAVARGAAVKIQEPAELGMAILGFSGASKGAPH
ncbi:MAG TPA: hypothetical protein VFR54_03390 [Xanthobacteraceae bacterium]|nr:hypothetical protein [Xanthobacteraceae bacterium]